MKGGERGGQDNGQEQRLGKWQGVGEGMVDRRERGEQSRFRPSQWTLGLSGPSELAGRRRHPILESWIRGHIRSAANLAFRHGFILLGTSMLGEGIYASVDAGNPSHR